MNELVLLLPLFFLGGVISTVAGGGMGIVMIIAATLFLDIRSSIALASLLTVAIQLAKIAHFYRYARWNVVGWYIALGIPMSYAGGVILFAVPERIPKTVLAVVALLFVAIKLARRIPTLPATRTNLVIFGGVNGLVGGLVGNAAMMRLPVLLSLGLSKEVLVGTSAVIAFPMNLSKLAAYIPNIIWTESYITFFFMAIPTIFLSVWFGKKILKNISKQLFEKLLLGIIFIGAIRLLLL